MKINHQFWVKVYGAQRFILDDVIFANFGISCLNFNCLDWFSMRFQQALAPLGITLFLSKILLTKFRVLKVIGPNWLTKFHKIRIIAWLNSCFSIFDQDRLNWGIGWNPKIPKFNLAMDGQEFEKPYKHFRIKHTINVSRLHYQVI